MRISTTFEEVFVKATHYYKDENGKKRQKTRKFFQTLNPYNKGEDGFPKSRQQIYKEISAEADAWIVSMKAQEK